MSRRKKKSSADETQKQSPPVTNPHKKTVKKKTKSPKNQASRWDDPADDDDDLTLPSYGSFLNELDYDVDLDWEDEKEPQKTTSTNSPKAKKKSRRGKSKKQATPVSQSERPAREKELFFEDDDEDDLTLPSYGRSHRPVISPQKEDVKNKNDVKQASSPKSEAKSADQKKKAVPSKRSDTAPASSQQKHKSNKETSSGRSDKNRLPQGKKIAAQGDLKKTEVKSQAVEKTNRKRDNHPPVKTGQPQRAEKELQKKQQLQETQNSRKPVKTDLSSSAKTLHDKERKSSPKQVSKNVSSKAKQVEHVTKQEPKKGADHKNPKPTAKQTSPKSAFRFGSLKLSQPMLNALETAGYLEPTPVQEGVIPLVMQGKDVMGQAQTGTGKTAAFLIPILEGLDDCGEGDEPVALILVPTRELAVQVRDEGEKLAQGRDIRLVACYGGKPISDQIKKLRSGADIVVGTPGRILDLASRRVLSLDSLFWVVLDEADRMLDIGFRPDIEKILRQTPADRQTLLLSATLPPAVVKLAERYMKKPEVVDFSDSKVSVETIEQYYITVDRERKFAALVQLLNQEKPTQAIIFCRTKRGVDRLFRQLEDKYKGLAALHSDMAQKVRDRVMAQFRSERLKFLVATDVIGRGIDVSGISHIINYDIPSFCDDYVHRVGRTGRMGREGVAYTLVTAEEGPELTRIEMRINRLLKRAELKGFQAVMQVEKEEENSPAKPVFGKTSRRIRRAL